MNPAATNNGSPRSDKLRCDAALHVLLLSRKWYRDEAASLPLWVHRPRWIGF